MMYCANNTLLKEDQSSQLKCEGMVSEVTAKGQEGLPSPRHPAENGADTALAQGVCGGDQPLCTH
jgi:hypothetical protein